MKMVAGYGSLINADGGVMPDTKTLNVWMEGAQEHRKTLHVIVKVLGRETGDVLSLKGGSYDASKIRPAWDKTKWDATEWELSLEILAGATTEDIQAALRALWLETEVSDVASTRNIAVFPTLPGLRLSSTSKYLRYRVDETRGLVRYYLHDVTRRTVPDALAAAAGRSLFGKKGYLGVPTSAEGLLVYKGIATDQAGGWSSVHVGLSDEDTEGQWVIMAGPRQGQVFWDHSTTSFGPGAQGSGWNQQGDIWSWGQPDTRSSYDYARVVYYAGFEAHRNRNTSDRQPSVTHFDLWLSDGEFFVRPVDVEKSPPNPFLHIDLGKARVDPGQRLVLTENHILVNDVDTVLSNGNVDASKITLRVSGVSGGTLQSRASASADWGDMTKAEVNGLTKNYYAFTLAELRDGKVSFLAGDGLASGNGEKIVFRIQAADAGDPATPGSPSNLSDSDPTTSDLDPVDVEISIVPSVEVSSGFSGLVNEDGMLTPSPAKLGAWIESAESWSSALHVIVRLGDKQYQNGDILSLRTGYDATKIKKADWDATKKEIDIEFARGTTASEIKTALELLELTTASSISDSTRKIWLFPTLIGVSKFAYHFDESEGLARYYLFENDLLKLSEAFKEASERIFFDVHGYMGVPTSTPEIRIYTAFGLLADDDIHLAVTDSATEGKWLIMSGPRKGQLFWDHTADPKEYGYGARGSGWSAQDDFWASGHPADSRSQQEDIAMMYEDNIFALSVDGRKAYVIFHDLWAQEGGMFSRVVEVKVSSSSPVLEVDFGKFQATSQRPLILTEDQISVDDPDTRVQGNVDASKITLRVSDVVNGTLKKLSVSDVWVEMTEVSIGGIDQGYYAFTLADLQGGLIAFFPDPGVSTLTFKIQAADDDGNLSDSDLTDNDADPTSVSIPVVVLKEIEAGQKVALNDDRGLTPDTNTLQAWMDASSTPLTILVKLYIGKLQGGKSGIVVPGEGTVAEALSLSVNVPNITVAWDGSGILSLSGSSSATRANFEAALAALQLQTVRFKDDSYRTISIHPDITEDVPKKNFYVREVKVGASPQEPLLNVRGFERMSIVKGRNLVLGESHISVDDVDTLDPLDNTKVDASRIKFRITGLTGGTLQKRASDSDPWSDVDLTLSTQYREFSLADLRGGLVSLKALLGASSLSFDIQAVDDGPHLSDSDPNTLGAQPSSVSILAVSSKTFAAGEEVRINDDKALTPDDNTLGAWLTADDALKIFVKLQGGRSGVFTPSAGVVRERLSLGSHSVPDSRIVVSWHWGDDGDWRLSLAAASSGSAAVADFQAVLDVLQMQTVHFTQASTRTILVEPDTSDMSVPVARTGYYVREVDVSASLPNPILEVDFKKVRVDAGQRLVLGEEHIMVYDPDTQDVNDDTDADRIKFRITQIQGGKLQRQSSSSVGDWDDIDLVPTTQYREFTLADLKAGKIALQGGDGLQESGGLKITFEIQAADDGDGTAGSAPNLSDSDSTTNALDPVDVEIVVVAPIETTGGYRVLLNADGVLSPDVATFGMWLENARTYSGTLQVVVKLFGKLSGDVLSLRTGYDTNKITSGWNQATGELSLTLTSGTTVSDIQAALKLLELDTELSASESTRKVWIFPTLSGVSNFRYRADEAAGLVRYYLSGNNLLSVWGEVFVRPVEVAESPPNPVLRVDFKFQVTAQRPLILTEDHLSVKDIDTRDPLDDTKVDASKIKFRITNIQNGTLQSRLASDPDTWTKIVADGSNAYLEFTLAQLQSGLVAFFPDAATSPLTFDIQAADDGLPSNPGSPPHLSDSDRSTSDPDPESVSVPVVVLKKVVVGEEVRINDDGVLTPHDDTLDEWLAADDTLRIFVVLQGGKSGIFTPSGGVVHEHLSVASSHGVASSEIAVSWDARSWTLSLAGTNTATRANFQAVLGALQLRTVPYGQVSYRTISVQADTSDMLVPVARAEYYRRGVEVSASAPNPILEVDFEKVRVDSGQRLVLTEKHISVYDPDTADASSVWLRVTGLTGGELQRRSSSSESDWSKIVASGKAYLEFTLADLEAGKIAFLAGDGVASADGGEGTKVVFQVQAADAPDNNANLSDSDPNDGESDADPVGAEILVDITAKATAGFRGLINADGLLSPNVVTLGAWKQEATTHSGTLHVIVRLGNMQDGDILSLPTGYDASKVTPRWDQDKGELSLEIASGATEADIQAALKLLEFNSELSASDSTRKVWVFPTLSGVSGFRYRADEAAGLAAGLVRYYFYDNTYKSFSAAQSAASARILFGKQGYLGVFTSNAEKIIYRDLSKREIHLAISDDGSAGTTEGMWVVTDGPRKGQLFWNHVANPKVYGPGAEGSGWTLQRHFWSGVQPDNWGGRQDYAELGSDGLVRDGEDDVRRSVSHHDFWLSRGGILARLVEVAESPPNPVWELISTGLRQLRRVL